MRDTGQPIAVTIPGAAQMSGIGRTRIYELIAEGRLEARKSGARTLVMVDSLRSYLSNLPAASIRAPRKAA